MGGSAAQNKPKTSLFSYPELTFNGPSADQKSGEQLIVHAVSVKTK